MKKFFTQFFLFTFLLVIIYFSIHQFHQNNHETRIEVKKSLIAESRKTDWVIIGDSQGESCLYFGPNSVNLSIAGADATQQYFFLKRFLQNHRPKAVVACFSPHHFEGKSVDFFSEIVANKGLELAEFQSMLKTEKTVNYQFDQKLTMINWYMFRYHLHSNTFTELASLQTSNKGLKDTLIKYRGTNIKWGKTKKFKNSIESKFFTTFDMPKFNMAYIDSIKSLGKEKRIPIYWLPIPLKSFYPYSNTYLAAYFTFMKSTFGNLYWDNPQFYSETDFGDDFHLNDIGMIKYSDSVSKFINSKTGN